MQSGPLPYVRPMESSQMADGSTHDAELAVRMAGIDATSVVRPRHPGSHPPRMPAPEPRALLRTALAPLDVPAGAFVLQLP